MTAIAGDLKGVLARLHERGVLDEGALCQVCDELAAGQPLTRDHLIQIFGWPVYRLITTRDETRIEFLKQAVILLTPIDARPEGLHPIDRESWLKAVKPFVEE